MAKMDLIVRRAQLDGKEVDIFVADGKIAEVKPAAKELDAGEATVEEAFGLTVMASMTDVHVHLREPGFEYKEDVESGLRAAAWGGFSNILCMANTKPVNDDTAVTRLMLEQAEKFWPDGPRLFPIGALTKGLKGEELAPMGELAAAGCVAFSNDGLPVGGAEMFRRCMEYAADFGKIVIDHCEDPSLARGTHMNEGVTSGRMGVKGQSVVAESVQVARDILLAEYLGIPVHLAHISCRQSVELIAWAKQRGVRVTAETCPHYLLLDDLALEQYSTAAKVNPPLRTPDDVAAMRRAVADGTIDILVTDHAPHAAHEKDTPLDEAPNGISGLDTAVALTWRLVQEGLLTEADMVRLWCHAPGSLFRLPVNRFTAGDPADFFLFDPAHEWTVTPEAMHSKGKNTPFTGWKLTGKVTSHWMGGHRIA